MQAQHIEIQLQSKIIIHQQSVKWGSRSTDWVSPNEHEWVGYLSFTTIAYWEDPISTIFYTYPSSRSVAKSYSKSIAVCMVCYGMFTNSVADL